MIDTVLELQWTPYGIECGNTALCKKAHKFLREAVLDRHIYLYKAIGFQFTEKSGFRLGNSNYVIRHEIIGESYPEVSVNLSDKVFMAANSGPVDVNLKVGMNMCDTSAFLQNNGDVETMYTNNRICQLLKGSCHLKIHIARGHGYVSMSDNSKLLDASYFPMHTDYSLNDYVRIPPIEEGDTLVPIRYYNKMTPDKLKYFVAEWRALVQSYAVDKEEAAWVRRFTLC